MATTSIAQIADAPVDRLRAFFIDSVEDETAIDRAEAYLATIDVHAEPVWEAYAALFEIMRAKHVFWPGRKMDHLNAGLPVLDRLVEALPDDVEIRYIRLMSCYYLPRFLGRGWSVDADFAALSRLLPGAQGRFPAGLYAEMLQFVYEAGDPDDATRLDLERALARLGPITAREPAAGGD